MSAAQPRQPKGIPAGGRYAADARSEPEASLAGVTSRPAPSAVQDAIRSFNEQISQLRSQRDGAHIQAAVDCVRRDFPTATEIRMRNNVATDGCELEGMVATGLRAADGSDPSAGDPGWTYREAEAGFCLAHHLMAYENQHAPSARAFEWDHHTEEWVLPVRDYWTPTEA